MSLWCIISYHVSVIFFVFFFCFSASFFMFLFRICTFCFSDDNNYHSVIKHESNTTFWTVDYQQVKKLTRFTNLKLCCILGALHLDIFDVAIRSNFKFWFRPLMTKLFNTISCIGFSQMIVQMDLILEKIHTCSIGHWDQIIGFSYILNFSQHCMLN